MESDVEVFKTYNKACCKNSGESASPPFTSLSTYAAHTYQLFSEDHLWDSVKNLSNVKIDNISYSPVVWKYQW